MYAYPDDDLPPPREHPWTFVDGRPDLGYLDFKKKPELIREVLEDFKPLEQYPAIQKFYDLLEWANGDGSIFETNDCALSQPKVQHQPPEVIPLVSPIVIYGRITLLYRDLELNADRRQIKWLTNSIFRVFSAIPNFPAVVKVGLWPHLFTAIGKEGNAVTLGFWAWGSDEAHTMINLGDVFEIIHNGLRSMSEFYASQIKARRIVTCH